MLHGSQATGKMVLGISGKKFKLCYHYVLWIRLESNSHLTSMLASYYFNIELYIVYCNRVMLRVLLH